MVVCKYYQTGFCRFGDRCRFEHVDRVNYPSNQQRYPEQQYVNRFPGSNYINNPVASAVVTGTGSGYNQRGSMVALKKPDQYHYVASVPPTVYDRQFQASGGQSFNHQSRLHGHTGHSASGGAANTNNGASGSVHQTHHHHPHHQQQHGIMPVQYWQVQQQQHQQHQHQQQQQQHQHQHQQRHQQMQPTSSNHHQSHSSNQRQAQAAHHGHGQGQSVGHHPSGSGGQHHQQSAGFSFNQKLKEIESSQKPQVGFSFNRALQQIQHQYQPHLAQQAQNQYYLTPTPMLTVPVQAPYYGVTMPMPMTHNPLATMFPSMMPTNNPDPKMISSYLPQQQQSTQGKISMNLSDDDSGIYSIMSSLTPEELNQYKADKFTFPHIPINPPPKELCL